MKRNYVVLFLIFISWSVFSQDEKTKQLLSSIEGKYLISDQGDVVIQKIIKDSTKNKEVLYNTIKQSLITIYRNANSVIQIDDKEGGLIVCKGIFDDLLNAKGVQDGVFFTGHHLLKIEIKDGRARITIILNNIERDVAASQYAIRQHEEKHISQYYTFNNERTGLFANTFKSQEGRMFYNLTKRSIGLLENIEKSIMTSTPTKTNDNW